MPDVLQRLMSYPCMEADVSEERMKNVEELERELRMESGEVASAPSGFLLPPTEFESSAATNRNESYVLLDNPIFNSTPAKKRSTESESVRSFGRFG